MKLIKQMFLAAACAVIVFSPAQSFASDNYESLKSYIFHIQEDNTVASSLVDLGKSFYQEGNRKEAIHEFSKALLVDPYNKEAKEYLKKLGLKSGLYQGVKTEITDLVGKLDHREALDEVERLAKVQDARELEIDVLNQKITAREGLKINFLPQDKKRQEAEEALLEQSFSLAKNQRDFLNKVDELINSLEFLDNNITLLVDSRMAFEEEYKYLEDLEKEIQATNKEIDTLHQEQNNLTDVKKATHPLESK